MKKCEYTLNLVDHKGKVVWSRSERKKKVCFRFIDSVIDENLIQSNEPLMDLLIHLEQRPDYGVSVLRAGVRRERGDKE
jgi:hypothetical protein